MIVEIDESIRFYHRLAKCEEAENEAHTILILDKTVQAIPWESMPCLRGKSVTRVPSLLILKQSLDRFKGSSALSVGAENGRFILNPGGDLVGTENEFKHILSKYRLLINLLI